MVNPEEGQAVPGYTEASVGGGRHNYKLELANKISRILEMKGLTDFEKNLANKIFTVLASDAELHLRKNLADRIINGRDFSDSAAMKIAEDIVMITEPILTNTAALSDKDIAGLTNTAANVAHKIYLSVRDKISAGISGDSAGESEEKKIISAQGKELTEKIIMQVLDNFAGSATILESLIKRGDIALTSVEKMVAAVSGDVTAELVEKHGIDSQVAARVVTVSREFATLGLLSLRDKNANLDEVMDQLYKSKVLTPSMILRSLCIGDIMFFQHALGRMSGLGFKKANQMILDRNEKSFMAVYRASNMPMGAFNAVRVVLLLALEETEGGLKVPPDYQLRMMERLMEEGYGDSVENMSYIISMISTGIKYHADGR